VSRIASSWAVEVIAGRRGRRGQPFWSGVASTYPQIQRKAPHVSTQGARALARAAAPAAPIIFGLFALTIGVACAEALLPPDIPQVTVTRATKECFSATVRVSGFLVPRQEGTIRIDPDGSRITEVLVGAGDTVTGGQVMARLARPTLDPAGSANSPPDPGARAPANVPSTGTTQGTPPPSNVPVRAPFAGRVIESAARVGATASPFGEPLFRIAADGEIELQVEVPGIYVPILAPGQTARVELPDGRELRGRVRLVSVEIDPMTQLGRARISLDDDASLLAGQFVDVTIDARRSCGVAVPRSAISYRANRTSVLIVRADVVETRDVRIGLRSDRDAEIQEGLVEGDVVVANAGTSLRDGDKVKPVFHDKGE
jgi:HlyD family secretion protein